MGASFLEVACQPGAAEHCAGRASRPGIAEGFGVSTGPSPRPAEAAGPGPGRTEFEFGWGRRGCGSRIATGADRRQSAGAHLRGAPDRSRPQQLVQILLRRLGISVHLVDGDVYGARDRPVLAAMGIFVKAFGLALRQSDSVVLSF